MSSPQIVLHLGAHKTGTSAIQRYMEIHADLCAANRVGFLPRPDGGGLLQWGRKDQIEAARPELDQRLAASEAAGDLDYVISQENLVGPPFVAGKKMLYPRLTERAGNIRDALDGRPIRVLFYIREQGAFLESFYLQTVNQGESHSFKEWCQAMHDTNLSWGPVCRALGDVFGAANVIIRSFDADIAAGQAEFLRRFFAGFRTFDPAAWKDFAYDGLHNMSLGDKGLAIALAVNKFLERGAEQRLMRDFLQDNFSNRRYARPSLMKPEKKLEMAEAFAAENAALLTP